MSYTIFIDIQKLTLLAIEHNKFMFGYYEVKFRKYDISIYILKESLLFRKEKIDGNNNDM